MTNPTESDINEDIQDAPGEANPAADAPEMSEVDALKAERDKFFTLLQQNQAEFENFRKRTRKEKQEWQVMMQSDLLLQLLPIVDNFERAMKAHGEAADLQAFHDGMQLIYLQFQDYLRAQNVEKIDTDPGATFNPDLHQAVYQEPTDAHPAGAITQTTLTGYKIQDRVLRHSQVAVAKPAEENAGAEEK